MEYLALTLHHAFFFFVIISVIVFIHEFGHYIVAKWCGVKIDAFSIGFGKELCGWTDRSGTRWKISMLPLGGYVKMFGDASEASTPDASIDGMTEEEKKISFHHKPLHKKAAIVAAGPIFNFILSIVIFTVFAMGGRLATTDPVIGEVMKDTPAEAAGLQPQDRILSINGEEVDTFSDILTLILTNVGSPVTLILDRGGEKITKTIVPKQTTETDDFGNKFTRPIIGIRSLKPNLEKRDIFPALALGINHTYQFCRMNLTAVWQMITLERSPKDLKGPLGIAKLSGQTAGKSIEDSNIWLMLSFIAMLSASLGLVNLFPIPLLDGGHLLFYAVEALRGRPMARKVQEYGYRLGAATLILLMVFASINDIRDLFS